MAGKKQQILVIGKAAHPRASRLVVKSNVLDDSGDNDGVAARII